MMKIKTVNQYARTFDEYKKLIDGWLHNVKETDSLIAIHTIVSALQKERELIDHTTFHVPLRRISSIKAEDIEAIMQNLMHIGVIAAGTNEKDIINDPKQIHKDTCFVGIKDEPFDYLYQLIREKIEIVKPEALSQATPALGAQVRIELPDSWNLTEYGNYAVLSHFDHEKYRFLMLKKRPYLFFKELAKNYGRNLDYSAFRSLDSSLAEMYKKGKSEPHKTIRAVIYSLNNLFDVHSLPMKISTQSESFILKLTQ